MMKLILILSTALTTAVFSQDVVPDIKGYSLGMTLEQCIIKKMGESEYKSSLEQARESRGQNFYWGIPSKKNPNVVSYSLTWADSKVTIGGAKASITGGFKKQTPQAKSVLYYLSASFSKEVANVVLDGLTEKYGPPSFNNKTVKTNRMGAKFSGFNAFWNVGGRYTINLESIGNNVEESTLEIMDLTLAKEIEKSPNPLKKDI